MEIKINKEDIGRLVSIELERSKEKLFGKIIGIQEKGIQLKVIPVPYSGEMPIKEIPYDDIKKCRTLPS